MELLEEKGAGAWLTMIPIQSTDCSLNKEEFRDAIRLRYNWKIPGTAPYCACGEKNSTNHTLICKRGGYVHMRHNNIRDFEASLLREICKDVRIEPELIPLGQRETTESSNTADKARLDVSAVGIWGPMQRTFLDVRVFHPNSPSYQNKQIADLYVQHENEKKRTYNHRVMHVEKGSFSPLIFSTTGGMGPEATRYHKKFAELLSVKRGEAYSVVMNYIRTKLRVSLLRSTLVAIRGERGKRRAPKTPLSELSLNLIPERQTYEV